MTETTEKKDVVPSAYRDKYKETGGTNGDFIATALQRLAKDGGVDTLNTVKAENGIEATRWSTFNPGMQRMNLANVLRGTYLKGNTIKILAKEYNAVHQRDDYTGKVDDTDKALKGLAEYLGLTSSDRTIASLRKLFFPPAPTGKTAEERAAEKAAKDKAKSDEKAAKAKVKADEKAAKDEAAAKAKQVKADAKVAKDEAAAKAKQDKADAKAKADAAKSAK